MTVAEALRVLDTGPGEPSWNMAADEAVLHGVLEGGPPVLRLYGWNPPGLSLGRFQGDDRGVDTAFCGREGIAVVRRATGGRAVLHHLELTYAVAARLEPPFGGGSVAETYAAVAGGLAAGLARLGVAVEPAGRRRGGGGRPAECFAATSLHELSWGGRKLVGSAQVRRAGAFLQHGSVLLDLDRRLWEGVFGPGAGRRAVTLREILGRHVSRGEAAAALAAAFPGALGLVSSAGRLTPAEEALAARLAPRFGACRPDSFDGRPSGDYDAT